MNTHNDRLAGSILTVVIRDDSPMIHCQDSPVYRTVRISLTDDQRESMALRCTGVTGTTPIYETISKCFIETAED